MLEKKTNTKDMTPSAVPYYIFKEKPEDLDDLLSDDDSDEYDDAVTFIDYPEMECDDLVLDNIAILPLPETVLFPTVTTPIPITGTKSLNLVKKAFKTKEHIVVVCQKDAEIADPKEQNLFQIGTITEVVKFWRMPDGSTMVVLKGKKRCFIVNVAQEEPHLRGEVTLLPENKASLNDEKFLTLMEGIRDLMIRLLKSDDTDKNLLSVVRHIEDPIYLINFLAMMLPLGVIDKQKLLQLDGIKDRAFAIFKRLTLDLKMIEFQLEINDKTHEDLHRQQRDHFLHAQLKTIQEELGGGSDDSDAVQLRKQVQTKKWAKEVSDIFERELRKLERIHPHAPEYSTQLNYLKLFVDLPWGVYSKDHLNLKSAQKTLDREHYGLESVKERILEHLAVLKLRGDFKSPIICLLGPPGVGKTSLCKSIAESLKRKYVRIALGGLHDESEVRGHRRTYIGAMPGRIINGMIKAGTSNPVFVLDEIDKIGQGVKGDPQSALLEVLDPEQNKAFHDNYLDVDYDLSNVFFIATANNLNTIDPPLLDRMEVIDISGYIIEEKIEIARRHLLPKQLEAHGIDKALFDIPKKTMEQLISYYSRESGVRQLDKKIAKVLRKIARKVASGEEFPHTLQIADLETFLGSREYFPGQYEGNNYAGVVTGLAWTPAGGDVLVIETSLSKNKKDMFTMTGNLGNVMKESATLAMEYIKSHADELGIDSEILEQWGVHIHFPEGAIPKDGPSAGITTATALVSSFTQRKVRPYLAMTGEITLRGRVLPVGGIKEKLLAAKRAGIKDVILCEENKRDVKEIKESYLKGLTLHYVTDIRQVLDIALLPELVANPLKLK